MPLSPALTWLPDSSGRTSATLGADVVTNGSFTGSATGWTLGANWAYGGNKVTHSAGAVAALSQSIAQVDTTHYLVMVTTSGWTAGNFTFTINGITVTFYNTIETQVNATNRGAYVATSTGSVTLAITPSTDFDGSIDDVSVKPVSAVNVALSTLRDIDGSNCVEVRGDASQRNLFFGIDAGLYNLTDVVGYGVDNVVVSPDGFANNLTGYENTAMGSGALEANGAGYGNSAYGYLALNANTSGFQNSGMSHGCLASNTIGAYNTALGSNAMYSNTSGISNVAVGVNALYHSNTNYNIAIGSNVLGGASFSGSHNDGIGIDSQTDCTTGKYNESHGYESLRLNTTGDGNVAIGHQALRDKVTGSHNTALGYQAANGQTAGARNIAIGYAAALPSLTGDDQLNIGNTIYGNLATDQIVIGATAVVASALFALVSTTLGFLPPKMTETQRDAISSPTPGLIVFNTTTNKLNLRGGAGWEVITSA